MHVGKHMDIPFQDRRVNGLAVVAESPNRVCLGYDPAAFNERTSGRVELRLRTPRAAEIATLLNNRQRPRADLPAVPFNKPGSRLRSPSERGRSPRDI